MKVVFLCGYPFYAEQRFGVSEYIYQLCKALAQRQVACHVLSMHNQTESIQVYPNIWVHTLQRKRIHYICPWIAANELGAYVQRIEPSIINLHCTTLPYIWVALGYAKRYPVVATVHGDVLEESTYRSLVSGLWARLISVPLTKQALSRLDSIVVLSSHMKARMTELTRSRVHVVPGGVDIHEYDVAPSLDTSKPSYVLFIGRLHKVKGPRLVLSTLPHVIRSVGPVTVYFAGTGPEQGHLVNMVKQKDLEGNAEFLGYVSGSQKIDLIQQAILVVVPSLYESFDLVSLEAMACGKPVIAARVGGIPEIVRHRETGLLFDPGDTAQLAECIVELLLNPELRLQYGQAARRRVESYAWPEVGDQMIDVYRECMAHYNDY